MLFTFFCFAITLHLISLVSGNTEMSEESQIDGDDISFRYLKGFQRAFNFMGGMLIDEGEFNYLNLPSSRGYAAGFEGLTSTNIFIHGGYGYDVQNERNEVLCDLWEYSLDLNAWKFWGGSGESQFCVSSVNVPNDFAPEEENYIGERYRHFGVAIGGSQALVGLGRRDSPSELFGDLWKYDIQRNLWKRVFDNQGNVFNECGEVDIYSPLNQMSVREYPLGLKLNGHEVLFFGGFGFGAENSGDLNDVWKYNFTSEMYKWVAGNCTHPDLNSKFEVFGEYGTTTTSPGGRQQVSGAVFAETNEILLYGGYGPSFHHSNFRMALYEFWMFNYETLEFKFIHGRETHCANAGVIGGIVPGYSNIPPWSKRGVSVYSPVLDAVYMFGGNGPANFDCKDVADVYSDEKAGIIKFDATTEVFSIEEGVSLASCGDVSGKYYPVVFVAQDESAVYLLSGVSRSKFWDSVQFTQVMCALSVESSGEEEEFVKVDERPQVYGTQGHCHEDNYPLGRAGAATVNVHSIYDMDLFFMFFGLHYHHGIKDYRHFTNEVWKWEPYNTPSSGMGRWTFLFGDKSDVLDPVVNYQDRGEISANFRPIPRWHTLAILVDEDRVWFFGGHGGYTTGGSPVVEYQNLGNLNDVIEYSITLNEFGWFNGNSTVSRSYVPTAYFGEVLVDNQLEVYHLDNVPSCRCFTSGWKVDSQTIFIFGGLDDENNLAYNDLWVYSLQSHQFKKISHGGMNLKEVPSPRYNSLLWPDKYNSRELYFYGGESSHGREEGMNDIWKFSLDALKFTYLRGSTDYLHSPRSLDPKMSVVNSVGMRIGAHMMKVDDTKVMLFQGLIHSTGDLMVVKDLSRKVWLFDVQSKEAQVVKSIGEGEDPQGKYSEAGVFESWAMPGARESSTFVHSTTTSDSTSSSGFVFGGVGTLPASIYNNDLFQVKTKIFTCGELFDYQDGVCANHGVCEESGCVCEEGYGSSDGSDDCGEWDCFGVLNTDKRACNKRGECVSKDRCLCDRNAFGSDCSVNSCFGRNSSSKSSCNSKGKCVFHDFCVCERGYSGMACEKENTFIVYRGVFVPLIIFGVLLFIATIAGIILMVFFILRLRKKVDILNQIEDVELILSEQKLEKNATVQFSVKKSDFEIPSNQVELIEVIGRGATATVYLAKYNEDLVAFKGFESVLLGAKRFDDLESELRVLINCRGPSILEFYGVLTTPPRVGLLMEYCKNGSIEGYLREHSSDIVSFQQRCRLLLEIANGMNFLQSKSIIHRDLKPPNILVSQSVNAKITDFGVAKSLLGSTGRDQTLRVGTRGFMSPEVYCGKVYGYPTDVFSYGICAWCITTNCFIPYMKGKSQQFDVTNVDMMVATNPDFRPPMDSFEVFHTRQWLRDLIVDCVLHDPSERPTFKAVISILKKEMGSISSVGQTSTAQNGKGDADDDDVESMDVHSLRELCKVYRKKILLLEEKSME